MHAGQPPGNSITEKIMTGMTNEQEVRHAIVDLTAARRLTQCRDGLLRRARCVARRHQRAKLCKFLRHKRWAGVMRRDAAMLWRKAECQCRVEFLERLHLSIKPRLGVRAIAVGPAQSGAQILHAQFAHPLRSLIEAVILKMKPLADAELGRVFRKQLEG